ncbi:CHAT domain-containing protein [Kitasatospora cathayae]|uniref:CHAT domain-containing protein n=1 Tax=Kitasatospora cathayae TaxID=3004092 RepID=A0ABY7PX55_9ACTN|nr:CHAT domain-containing protein [Kitasatospora sp. HUAS 3-15]WBP84994.1 CHAT domain-containing protein [Kitasatospora sp. HUAS 3-15]
MIGTARQIGDALFEAALPGEVAELYASTRRAAAARGRHLRLVLRLDDPQLAVLPWELMHSKEFGYLCLDHALVRRVEPAHSVAALKADSPLQVLAVAARAPDKPRLDVGRERNHLKRSLAALERGDLAHLRWVTAQDWTAMFAALTGGCHVFHFAGHGHYDEPRQEGALASANVSGEPADIHAEPLGKVIGEAAPRPQLVVLNGCETGSASDQAPFSSVAGALLRFVPAVVAMQFKVTDAAAIVFARFFHQALIALRRPIDVAVHQGRLAMLLEDDESLAWATPVLYVRDDQDIRLFDIERPQAHQEKAAEMLVVDEARLIAADAARRTRVTGTPALVQDRAAEPALGDFELLCPTARRGLVHLRRRNDTAGIPWDPPATVLPELEGAEAVGMVESDLGGGRGSLEVVARVGEELRFAWNGTREPDGWQLMAEPIAAGASGNPVLLQDRLGDPGDFELVCPAVGGGLLHLRRRNGVAGLPWSRPYAIARDLEVDAVCMVQSTFGGRDGRPGGNLELIARVGDSLEFFWKGPPPGFWRHLAFDPRHPLVTALAPSGGEPDPGTRRR